MSTESALARLPLFHGLSADELTMLKGVLRSVRLDAGQTLFEEGDRAPACFVLLEGTVGVYKGLGASAEDRLATLKPGALVGHVALIDGQPRSATCRADAAPVLLLRLDRDVFDRLFGANSPFAFKILDRIAMDLVERLRTVTARFTRISGRGPTESKQTQARLAAELLAGYDTSTLEIDGIDLDAITFSIPEGTPPPKRGPHSR